jgi:PAS domain S-box-containing protein
MVIERGKDREARLEVELQRSEERCRSLLQAMTEGAVLQTQTVEALRRSEATLRVVLNASRDSILLFDPDGTIRLANATALTRLGLTAEEAIGHSLDELVPPDLAQARQAFLREVIATGAPVEAEDERAGILFHHAGHPVFDDEGRPIQIASFSTDITVQKQAKEALEKAYTQAEEGRLMLEALLDNVPDGITVADAATGTLRLVSAYGKSLLAGARNPFTLEEVVQRWSIFQADGVTPLAPAEFPLMRAMEQGETLKNVEIMQENAEGKRMWLLCNAAPVKDRQGVIRAGIVVWREIGALKQAQQTLQKAVAELKRSNHDLGQFAFVASHDLQEPLRQVLAYVDQLRTSLGARLEGREAQYFGFVEEGANRMRELVRGLLDYAQVGTLEAGFKPVDSGAALALALIHLRTGILESEALITQDDLPEVLGNAGQLTQLFQNLLGNALKFSRPGTPPRIHVGQRREGDQVCISVEDQGIGIDPRYQDKVFQLFQRLHDRGRYPGTGIGLAICKKIVEQHGGKLWIEAGLEAGTRFCFTLPTP